MENFGINEELSSFKSNSEPKAANIHEKLDELVVLLNETSLDNDTIQELNKKFYAAIRSATDSTAMQPYSRSARNHAMSEEMDEELEQLLFINNLDKRAQRKSNVSKIVGFVVRIVIALLLILLGFGMIIMPAPPYFEMFTLFYLTANDGVTIMDVISLIVAFTGVYLIVSTITKFRAG